MGIATHKLSRLLAKDKVTSFIRAPFTRYQEPSGQGEVEEEPYGQGHGLHLRRSLLHTAACCGTLSRWPSLSGDDRGQLADLLAAKRARPG